jgi:hypothetical protein
MRDQGTTPPKLGPHGLDPRSQCVRDSRQRTEDRRQRTEDRVAKSSLATGRRRPACDMAGGVWPRVSALQAVQGLQTLHAHAMQSTWAGCKAANLQRSRRRKPGGQRQEPGVRGQRSACGCETVKLAWCNAIHCAPQAWPWSRLASRAVFPQDGRGHHPESPFTTRRP